jgi:hypothetical protein
MQVYELKLADGKVVTWTGTDGVDAAVRCADAKQVTVIAWRTPRVQLNVGIPEGC